MVGTTTYDVARNTVLIPYVTSQRARTDCFSANYPKTTVAKGVKEEWFFLSVQGQIGLNICNILHDIGPIELLISKS